MNFAKQQLLGRCLKFPKLKSKTVGQLFELPNTTIVEQFFKFPRSQSLISCLNFPRLEFKTVGQLFDLPKTHD